MISLAEAAWSLEQLPQAFELLVGEARLPPRRDPLPEVPDLKVPDQRGDIMGLDELMSGWLQSAARARGADLEATEVPFRELSLFFARGGPALVLVLGAQRTYLLVLGASRRGLSRLLLPSQEWRSVAPASLAEQVLIEWQVALRKQGEFVERIGLDFKTQESLRQAFLAEQLGPSEAAFAWMLQLPASRPLTDHLRQARLGGPMVMLATGAIGSTLLSLLAWFTLGGDALSGRIDHGRVQAWYLILLMTVPLSGLATYGQGQLSLRFAYTLKRLLLRGCLEMPEDQVRAGGLGRQLALLSESQVFEQVAITAVFGVLVAVADLSVAGWMLWQAAGARHLVLMLALWVVVCMVCTWVVYRRRGRWTALRLGLTDDLVAKMEGHLTRRVQQSPEHWHEGEDAQLADYWQSGRRLDSSLTWLQLMPRGWLLVAVVALLPLLLESGTSPLLVAVVGLLLSFQALQAALQGLVPLMQLRLAAQQLHEPLEAATRSDPRPITFLAPRAARAAKGPIVELFDVVFRYRSHGAPVLRGCNLTIQAGDRLLVGGSSGGGKSTLAALIAGLRSPESGLILVADFDQHTLNQEAWRRVVATAPQFHDNHIFANSLAFNLLCGRRWPASDKDLAEAVALCEELGLGPLLARMPNGLHQIVGDMGWRLSHGERSRIFIARALLQRSELLILDESFGALDPETLELCVATVRRHARALLVIAHP